MSIFLFLFFLKIDPQYLFKQTACAAKYLSMSSRSLDIYWDDGKDGVPTGSLGPGKESTANSYIGHEFYFTPKGNPYQEVYRIKMTDGVVSTI